MRLLRLRVVGFGVLQGEYRFAPDRLTLIVDDNERGKSTLLAAIAAALYGLDGDRRSHRMMTPLDRWRPWEGGPYRLELELESDRERLTITRDFDRNTFEVWDARGHDRTAEFREGRDTFPVGKKLFGLEVDEFEKCALIRQGDLDQVVPIEAKSRQQSTLHARLENAADTASGDTNANEALRVLKEAADHYTPPELGTTLKIETAIQRLETKRDLLDAELRGIGHALAQLAEPLEEMARLADDEEAARHTLFRLETERSAARTAQLRTQLEHDDARRAELESLRREAAVLQGLAGTPPGAEAELREILVSMRETQRALDALTAKQLACEPTRERLITETRSLETYDRGTADDARRLDARAAEIRRLDRERERRAIHRERLHDELEARGWNPERAGLLAARFGGLAANDLEHLRAQASLALSAQSELAAIEQVLAGSSDRLKGIRAHRHARRVPAWILLGMGLAAAAGGAEAKAAGLERGLWIALIGAGIVLAGTGLGMLVAAMRLRGEEHRAALARLAEAESRARRLKEHRAENERRLAAIAASLRYGGPVELLRDWSTHTRLSEETRELQQLEQSIKDLEVQRQALNEEIAPILERTGATLDDVTHLERGAAAIRQLLQSRERLGAEDKVWTSLAEEKRAAESTLTDLTGRAERILSAAGLEFDPETSWADRLNALTERSQHSARHTELARDRIPQLERLLLDPRARADLRHELEIHSSGNTRSAPTATGNASPSPRSMTHEARPSSEGQQRPLGELESEIARLHRELDELARRRVPLGPSIEHKAHHFQAERLEKELERERMTRALLRAQRFKACLDLAADTLRQVAFDTHRRWAEFLNRRVAELLRSVGTQIEEVRFGEDLDFSVKFSDGRQIARGKALVQLSSGARDQLHLAVRLAISEYLSRDREPLPLLIDDCFATSDDVRARAGMRLLIEHFSRHHQIVVVTCHRRRHEALAGLDAELYSRRVQWLEAGEASTIK